MEEDSTYNSVNFGLYTPWYDDSSANFGAVFEAMVNAGIPAASGAAEKIPVRMQFLERFTRDLGLVASFDCCTEEERLDFEHYIRSPERPLATDDLAQLECLSTQIVDIIAEVCRVKPRNSAVFELEWTSKVEDNCRHAFSALNIHNFLELYWAIWSPNVPFLHRPTFNTSTAKPVLIAAMVIIGASMSSRKEDHTTAQQFFNCVEEAVFRDEKFCTEEDRRFFPSRDKVQALQAAYIVMLYQNWEGTVSSKNRIRRFRYSTVVAVARDIGIQHARHTIYSPTNFEWQEFVRREELIRTFLWVFLLDTAFVIFNNVPPRMAIKEMRMNFALDEECFQAPDAESCLQRIMATLQHSCLLSTTCEIICKRNMTLNEAADMSRLGSLNLFVATSAIHSMLFQVQQSFNPQVQLGPIYNALANWHILWQQHSNARLRSSIAVSSTSKQELWQREGFARFAPEYWILASMLVQHLALQDTATESFENTVVKQETKEAILENYDTDMRQVNNLIAEFQRVML